MNKEKYYVVVMEEYEHPYNETPWRIGKEGLFKTYRDASQYLIEEGFEVSLEFNEFTEEYEIYFEVGNSDDKEYYFGYVEEWHVK